MVVSYVIVLASTKIEASTMCSVVAEESPTTSSRDFALRLVVSRPGVAFPATTPTPIRASCSPDVRPAVQGITRNA